MIPSNVGWLSVEDAWNLLDYKMDLKTSANVFQTGTLNTFGIYAFNTSLKLFKDFGFNKIESRSFIKHQIFYIKIKKYWIQLCIIEL